MALPDLRGKTKKDLAAIALSGVAGRGHESRDKTTAARLLLAWQQTLKRRSDRTDVLPEAPESKQRASKRSVPFTRRKTLKR